MKERQWYETGVQECFHGFALVAYYWILEYAKLDTSELCCGLVSVARGWKSRGDILGRGRQESFLVVGEKDRVPRCLSDLVSDIRPYMQSTNQGTDKILKYAVETETMEKRSKLIKSAGKGSSAWKKWRETCP